MKKYWKHILLAVLLLSAGRSVYLSLQVDDQQAQFRAAVEDYFLDGDENLKLSWFKIEQNTMALTIDVLPLEKPLTKEELERVKAQSRAYIVEKVCGHPDLVNYLANGNFISVDFKKKNGPSFMNIFMAKDKCGLAQ